PANTHWRNQRHVVELAIAVVPVGIAAVLAQIDYEAAGIDMLLRGQALVIEDAALFQLADQPVAAGTEQASDLGEGVVVSHAARSTRPLAQSSIHWRTVMASLRESVLGRVPLWCWWPMRSSRCTSWSHWSTCSLTGTMSSSWPARPRVTRRCSKVPLIASWVGSSWAPMLVR